MSLHSRCVVVEQRDLANPGQLILKLQCRPSRVDWLIEHKSSSSSKHSMSKQTAYEKKREK